jgi:succinate dehydrogenase / fumarate reductase flavoprotein subunit
MAAALVKVNKNDNWKVHFRDTMRGGKFHNVWRMAELHAKQAPEREIELEEWGAVFDRTKEGLISQRNFGGHRYPRLAHVGDRTGLELIRTLQDHGIHQGIHFHMECTALRLLKDGDRIAGVLAYFRETGRFLLLRCKAVILATGGAGKAWRVTSNSWEYTGDGYALAYEAQHGKLPDELIQPCPPQGVHHLRFRGIGGREPQVVVDAPGEDRCILLDVPDGSSELRQRYVPDVYASHPDASGRRLVEPFDASDDGA